jgi:hypothetical protein
MPKTTNKQKKELLDISTPEAIDDALKIVSGVTLNGITLKGLIWTGVITIRTILPKSYHMYEIKLELDESDAMRRIDELNADVDGTLFANDRGVRKARDEKIKEVRKRLDELRKECEIIKFSSTVDSLKYGSGCTTLQMRFPDDIVEPLNRQKSRLQLYKVTLIPLFEKKNV